MDFHKENESLDPVIVPPFMLEAWEEHTCILTLLQSLEAAQEAQGEIPNHPTPWEAAGLGHVNPLIIGNSVKKHPMNKEKKLLGPSRQGFPLEGCAPSRLPSPLLHWNVFKTGIPHWNVFKTHLNPKDGFNQAPSCRRSSALLISPKRTGISLRTGYFQLGVWKTSCQVHTTPLQAPGNPLAPDPDGKDGTGQVCSKSIQSKKCHQR